MEIRKDFKSAETFLHRLVGIGEQFAYYDYRKWPHLKNQEDFDRIYKLPEKERSQLENLYAKGRNCAIFMSSRLLEFNDIGKFPSLAKYLDSFNQTWVNEQDYFQEFIDKIKAMTAGLEHTPWAVQQMIEVFDDQLRLLASVRETVDLLKQTNLYKIEKGDAPVEKEAVINIGHINGKVNINSTDNSTDNSTNITIDSSSIFSGLSDAIKGSSIEEQQKTQLLVKVEDMKAAEGTASFSQKYNDFIQNAANHMAVISPFISALTSLTS